MRELKQTHPASLLFFFFCSFHINYSYQPYRCFFVIIIISFCWIQFDMKCETVRLPVFSLWVTASINDGTELVLLWSHLITLWAVVAMVGESRYDYTRHSERSLIVVTMVPCATVRSSTTYPLGPYQLASIILMKGVGVGVEGRRWWTLEHAPLTHCSIHTVQCEFCPPLVYSAVKKETK